MSFGRAALGWRNILLPKTATKSSEWKCLFCQQTRSSPRSSPRFSTSARARQEQHQNNGTFRIRLRTALRDTKVQWRYRIPIGLGIGFLGAVQFYRVQGRERKRHEEEQDALMSTEDTKGKPKKRERIRPSGPWYGENARGEECPC